MNPNTGTLPVFRTRVDADITLGIYSDTLSLSATVVDGNPWGLSFVKTSSIWPTTPGCSRHPEDLVRQLSTDGPTKGDRIPAPLRG